MTNKATTQKDYEHITLILNEAEKHGLRWEVEHTATKIIKEHPTMDIVDAFIHAFNDWVK